MAKPYTGPTLGIFTEACAGATHKSSHIGRQNGNAQAPTQEATPWVYSATCIEESIVGIIYEPAEELTQAANTRIYKRNTQTQEHQLNLIQYLCPEA